jgi:eukaryotic-like serine/threonine-protein kinase
MTEVLDLYLEASELAAPEQAAFLAQLEPGLRAQVVRLLQADLQSVHFLESPPVQLVADYVEMPRGPLPEGEVVGGYEIRGVVSIGGMGEIYRADNIQTRLPVALKLVRRDVGSNPLLRERFAHEAQAVGSVRHPNVVAIHEFAESEAGMFLAMEWVDGHTWRDLMDVGAIPLRDAIHWAKQAASGLAAVHREGITHRDIKPENLMLSRDGVVARLAGAALVDSEAHGASGTISGSLSGTFSYLPPELFRGEVASHATDVFSLGLVFYELFTGVYPFSGETPLDVYEAIENRTPLVPSSVRQGIPQQLDGLLLAMLDRERLPRPIAESVADALSGLQCFWGAESHN